MKKQSLCLLAAFLLLILFQSCKETIGSNMGGALIHVTETQRNDVKLGDLIVPTGFVDLKPSGECSIRSIQKLVFLNDAILIQDSESDFDNIWVFDNSGHFKQAIGQQEPLEEFGVNAMCALGDKISLLFPSRHSFYTFDQVGAPPRILKNSAFGDMMERLENGHYILYNEHNPTEVTGNNYIVMYDKDGNLLKKQMPYNPEKNAFGYNYTGFLTRSGKDIWFSPPMSDIVYEVNDRGCFPRYEFDFGSKKLPPDLASTAARGSDIQSYSFLNERFVTNMHFIQFEYQSDGGVCHGMFDETTGQSINLRNIRNDCLSNLFSRGTVMPKDEDEFVLVLRTNQVQSLVKNNLIDQAALNTAYGGLGDALLQAANDNHDFLAYFTYKPGANIPKI